MFVNSNLGLIILLLAIGAKIVLGFALDCITDSEKDWRGFWSGAAMICAGVFMISVEDWAL